MSAEPGLMKHDAQKSKVELIEPYFILGMGDILAFGADKYAVDQWKNATEDDVKRIYGALQRHALQYRSGELRDEETGKSHLLHLATNAMFLYYFEQKRINENVT